MRILCAYQIKLSVNIQQCYSYRSNATWATLSKSQPRTGTETNSQAICPGPTSGLFSREASEWVAYPPATELWDPTEVTRPLAGTPADHLDEM